MFDLVRFHFSDSFSSLSSTSPKSLASLGFERIYTIEDVKGRAVEANNLADATKHKNQKTLILLKDYAFDDGAMRLIAEKKKACFLIDIGRLIRSNGVPRAVAISKLRNFLRLAIKHGMFYSFASFAKSESEMRNADELMHIAMLLGINKGQAKFALMMLGKYTQ